MRICVLVAASTLLVGFAMLACSSSASEDTRAADAGTAAADAGTAGTTTEPPSTTTDAGAPDATDTGAPDATPTVTTDGGAFTGCAVNAVRETESNDSTPNEIPGTTGSFCGRLVPGDTDRISFFMPRSITSLQVEFERSGDGLLNISAEYDGQGFSPNGPWPNVANAYYEITLVGAIPAGKSIDYNVNFTFKR